MTLIAFATVAVLSQANRLDGGSVQETPEPQISQPDPQAALPLAPPDTVKPTRRWYENFTPFGYLKVGVGYTFPLQNEQLVGSNGGFNIANMRLGMQFDPYENFSVVASIEAAAPLPSTTDPTTGTRIVDLRDAYLEYRVCKGFWVRAGQFKAPYNAETLLDDARLPFTTRSVATLGLAPPNGYGPRAGLAQDRQVGIEIVSDRLGVEAFGFKYMVALVDGNGANQLFNDTNAVEPAGRIEIDFFKHIEIGVNAYYDTIAQGVRPNRIEINTVGYGADVGVRFGGFSALGGLLGHLNTYSASILPTDNSYGFMAQLHYVFESIGVEAGLRYAFLEPSTSQVDDQVSEITAMVGYRFKKVPLRVIAQYTHRGEEPAVSIPNDSVDAMVSVVW